MNNIGIDVSEAQGTINFDLITAEYVIIRVGVGSDIASQDDKQFARNVAECTRKGIPYGLYLYSYALNMDECLSEVKHFLRLYNSISDKSMLKLGCWYDMEDADHYKKEHMGGADWSNFGDLWSSFCNRWVDEVKKATGEQTVGVYASLSPLRGHLNGIRADIPKWVACWIDGKPDTSTPLFPNAYYWQYTNGGKMDGIYSRGLDMDISYIDVPSVRPTPSPTPSPTPTPTTNHKVGDVVSFNAIYTSSTSTNPLPPAVTSGTITQVIAGARNPYLINNGTGWVNDGCITGGSQPTPVPQPTPTSGHSVGENVSFNAIYVSSTSTEPLPPAYTNGTITQIINGARNPYLINDGMGWVNDACITGGTAPTPQPAPDPSISVGSTIRIKDGAVDLNSGRTYDDWVYQTPRIVKEINGNRVVFGDERGITGATDISNVYPA